MAHSLKSSLVVLGLKQMLHLSFFISGMQQIWQRVYKAGSQTVHCLTTSQGLELKALDNAKTGYPISVLQGLHSLVDMQNSPAV